MVAQAHVLAAVVEYRTPHHRVKRGLATDWLSRMAPHPTLPQACPLGPHAPHDLWWLVL